jgi:single-strand selective monofunctional uracil DNA glycosylase
MAGDTALIRAARRLRDEVGGLLFDAPVASVYNPLVYAWAPHRQYLAKWGRGPKRVLFLGMNPGPWGMAQVGVPFGEISLVRDWLDIGGRIARPEQEHPKRPVEGFACTRSEVSGRRLWGYIAARFGTPAAFFQEHFVANYCPLMFVEASGRNRTPDKLHAHEREALRAPCDAHLKRMVDILRPEWVVGVGAFAETRAGEVLEGYDVKVGRVLHPSPASPAANRDWAGAAEKQLLSQGIWSA